MKTINEIYLQFTDYSELSYKDNKKWYIDLYLNDDFQGHVTVYTDVGNMNKEYISVNNEVIYLENIFKLNCSFKNKKIKKLKKKLKIYKKMYNIFMSYLINKNTQKEYMTAKLILLRKKLKNQ